MNNNYYAVLMAGGVGSRFWPVSTAEYPKQFHDMLGAGASLLQKTFGRLARFIPPSQILVLTNARYTDLVLEQLPDIDPSQVVSEPAMRNTAPCILYAALKIRKMNPEAVMVVAPSDHWIEDEAAFQADVLECFDACSKAPVLCTLGIQPTFPNTGFGYIEFPPEGLGSAGLKPVHQFREKPDYATARGFLEQGNFLWNAGIFMWSVAAIEAAFARYQPAQYALFKKGWEVYNTPGEAAFIESHYPKAENISIDYAILEPSDSVFVLPARFDWNDLGTWGSLYEKVPKDAGANAVVRGGVLEADTQGNMIRLPAKKIAVIQGLKDYIVVDTEQALLIMPRAREQEIKQWVSRVKEAFGEDYI
ncbi:mannose-1-phosphate guanylyltransferase [Robiginitalea marina]|uniref:Sugar phosphate nucleotidyltransferase n=1 Tax=Robiginitalea marina TaxID=2954105 RepID=A0ABT1AZ22_9FLAO|nr:mannose-1-phosphate guanylyltransferase [Robiginitalea marina]MCO5725186.1 sugar phosphate nucleotidyltransferase [Robiginitalea marina]